MSNYNKSLFEGVPNKNPNKTKFNLSHEWKCNYVPGYLQPIFIKETLPNDYWEINSEFLFRFSPLYFPIMHKMTMRADYFYIPYRILWPYQSTENPGWQKWITEQSEVEHPSFTGYLGSATGDSFNYGLLGKLGLPLIPTDASGLGTYSVTISDLNAFPVSAYLKIWDEYYRNPQLEDERWFPLSSGDNTGGFDGAFDTVTSGAFRMLPSKWEKDYFTSAIPTPQVGDAIEIPIFNPDVPASVVEAPGGGTPAAGNIGMTGGELQDSTGGGITFDTSGTIRELRLAETLQHYYERIMKVGQRYRDFIKGLWGNDPEPAVIDRPVLIGSKFGRVQIADVMTQADTIYSESSTRSTGDYTGQANLYSSDNDRMTYHCNEHGLILGILQMNANTSYGSGIERMWRRSVQTDYPLDLFSGIGDQEILKEEVCWNPIDSKLAENKDTFGYIPRHSEMKYAHNMHIAEMQKGSGLSQHLGRIFKESSWLNYADVEISDEFISASNWLGNDTSVGTLRLSDVFRALPADPEGGNNTFEGIVYCHIYHSVYVSRNLPLYSTPRL